METKQHFGRASKGSQFHLQNLVNDCPDYLNCLLLSSSPYLYAYAGTDPKWVSPLASDNYTEYQDEKFLEVIGYQRLSSKLADFWPSGGPVWDALATIRGKTSGEGVILVEAKSHIPELGNHSYACKAKGKSLEKIRNSLATVKQVLRVKSEADWTGEFYQYANRLAHLYFLNIAGQVPTWMVFIYFVGDIEQNGPSTAAEWAVALDGMKAKLGLPQHHLLEHRVVSVFAPARRYQAE
jgi:hypothetical protein